MMLVHRASVSLHHGLEVLVGSFTRVVQHTSRKVFEHDGVVVEKITAKQLHGSIAFGRERERERTRGGEVYKNIISMTRPKKDPTSPNE